MKKVSNLGELSANNLTKQKTIEDTVTAQITTEFQSLKQIISDCVKSEVQSFLSDLKNELKEQQSEPLKQISESNQQLNQRIDSLIDNPALLERLDQLDNSLTQVEQRITQIGEKSQQRLQTLIEQTETQMESFASQTEQALEQRIDIEQRDYQGFLRQQRQWQSNVTKEFLLINKLPVSVILILFCLLVLSVAVNLTVLMKAQIWSTFVIVLVCLLMFILVIWALFIGYQIYQQKQAQEE